ncbi:hypothetical protein [Pseudonocardia sp. ICBG1034]|uniref:hypothetical protein n=1 Tax=Pseudonocardia sp. ICBG1034 TaxID=2844381 RepID=UPI001CCB3685|nr:hypothetical protein [Pseudonocardia sp. ICBG1034]
MTENGLSSIPDPAVADADGSSWEYGGRRLRVRVADERDVAALARLRRLWLEERAGRPPSRTRRSPSRSPPGGGSSSRAGVLGGRGGQ